jgi:DNA invertase Pin-like site-specific DNA recombinase
MKDVTHQKEAGVSALIYCRVSDKKQKTQGHGLESQEHRCRKYAEERGYDVEMVFPDDITGGVDFMKRPGMRAMLAYLDAQKGKPYVVIFDDLKRFARHTEFHLKLRREFAQRGRSGRVPQLQVRGLPRRRLHRDSDRSSRPA